MATTTATCQRLPSAWRFPRCRLLSSGPCPSWCSCPGRSAHFFRWRARGRGRCDGLVERVRWGRAERRVGWLVGGLVGLVKLVGLVELVGCLNGVCFLLLANRRPTTPSPVVGGLGGKPCFFSFSSCTASVFQCVFWRGRKKTICDTKKYDQRACA